jgi:haloacetate dehalogenase
MIGANPSFYMDQQLGALSATPGAITPEAVAEYKRVFTPLTIHGSCEDFRASEGIDLEMDAAAERRAGK